MTKKTTIEGMADWLRGHDDYVILGHINPDGDAVGSTLGLCHALRALGKRAAVYLPGGVPGLYAHLPGAGDMVMSREKLPFAPRTALAVDVSELPRMDDDGRALFEACPDQGVIDHHGTNRGFGQIVLLDGAAAAAGELAVEVIEALGLELSREVAECLFVAISTDCGHFSYSNTRSQTLRAAEKCLPHIDIDAVTTRLYRTRSLPRIRLLGLVLAGLEISEDGKIAWARLTQDMLRQAHAKPEDSEGIINYLLEIEGVCFAILAQERGDVTKLSLRSRPPMDVAADIAIPLGGGGHTCAAGATVKGPVDVAIKKALELARAALTP